MEQMSHNLNDALHDPEIFTNLTVIQALDIAMGILGGLEHLHGLDPKIIHRDVKPSNVLLALTVENGRVEVQAVKLNDFDLSKQYRDGLVSQKHCGTRSYMAPELMYFRAPGGRVNGEALDMYSFGKVLWELFTGGRAGPVNNPVGQYYCANYPKAVSELVVACMSNEPVQRPSAAGALDILRTARKACGGWGDDTRLSRQLVDVVDAMHSYRYLSVNVTGTRYGDVLLLVIACAREVSRRRAVVARAVAKGEFKAADMFIEKAEGVEGWIATFACPDLSIESLEEAGPYAHDESNSLDAVNENASIFVDLLESIFVVEKDPNDCLDSEGQLVDEVAGLMETLRRKEALRTCDDVADELQYVLDGGGEWLSMKATPCVRFIVQEAA